MDWPNLSGCLRDLYQHPGAAETVNMAHIKNLHHASHESVNPSRIVPLVPLIDHWAAHDRERLGKADDPG